MGNSRENAPETQTKNKPTTKQGKQRQRHAFAREAAVILQFVQVVKTRRKQEEEELCHHAGAAASLGPSPSSSRGCEGARDAVSRFLPLHMPGLLHQACKAQSPCKGKHLIMGSPGQGWIQRTCSSAFLNQGWALVVSKSQVFACLCWEGKPQISPEQASWSVYGDGSSELEHSSQAPRAEDGA